VPSDDLHQRLTGLQERLAPLLDAPAADAIVRRGRRRRARRGAALATAAILLVAALVVAGRGGWPQVDPGPQPIAPAPPPSVAPATTVPPSTMPEEPPTTSREPPTTTRPPAPSRLLLGVGGLGPATFGQTPDQVVDALRAVLGPPDEQRSWDQRQGQQFFGFCPGGNHRFARWGELYALFADGDTGQGPAGRQHFFAWYAEAAQAGGKRLQTAQGIAVGDTTAKVQDAYGNRALIWAEEGGLPAGFRVPPQGRRLFGWLTDHRPQGRVTTLAAGSVCGE
jgi:hypothetical protein